MMSTVTSMSIASSPRKASKGKARRRSWPQLPAEVIRLIATHFLWDLAATAYCPKQWDMRKQWQCRMVYTCLRDAADLEKFPMAVCPEWGRAIAMHPFWNQAIALLDPNDVLSSHMVIQAKNASSNASPIYLTPFQHFRNIIMCSCLVCRINVPLSNLGLTQAKRAIVSPYIGLVNICKDHNQRRAEFCGLCLRVTPPQILHLTPKDFDSPAHFGCADNEDEDMWPNVEATCRKCRVEWLWRRAGHHPEDREAIGGTQMIPPDWEVRQCVENFLDSGEGTVSELLILAREKHWLWTHTKYENLGLHALAAQQSTTSNEAEEEEEDDEEDMDAMFMRDAGQVREMALHDWARQRILDGCWVSPADIYYGNAVPGQPISVRAIHPCPWTREAEPSRSPTTSSAEEPDMVMIDEEEHPSPALVVAPVPPTFPLCEQAYIAHLKQMRELLAHPLKNLVRKIVIECGFETERRFEDPAVRAARMSLDDVVTILREEEGIWFNGVDWLERKRNEQEALAKQRAAEASTNLIDPCKEDDSSSTTSSSGRSSLKSSLPGSTATSPVLSASTLQTTPSPPPSSDDGVDLKKEATPRRCYPTRLPTIPVSPVRSPPQLLGSIPYVPTTTAHMPPYSLEAIKLAWRDACAPLYHCRCSICERAKMAQIKINAAYTGAAPPVVHSQQVTEQPLNNTPYPIVQAEIDLKESHDVEIDGDGEEEVDYDTLDMSDEEDEEDDDHDSRFEENPAYRYSVSPEAEATPHPRKRSCDELEEAVVDGTSELSPSGWKPDQREIGGTPPKRARIGELPDVEVITSPTISSAAVSPTSPARQRKRSSEELDDGGVEETGTTKRLRVDRLDRTSPLVESPLSTMEDDRLLEATGNHEGGDKSHLSSLGGSERSTCDLERVVVKRRAEAIES